jgi:hypothetical protein
VRSLRHGLVRSCRRHVAGDGQVLIQREPAGLYDTVPRESVRGELSIRIASAEPAGPGLRSVRVEYSLPDGAWSQTFVTQELSTEQFEAAAAEAGLVVTDYLTEDRTWVRARPR